MRTTLATFLLAALAVSLTACPKDPAPADATDAGLVVDAADAADLDAMTSDHEAGADAGTASQPPNLLDVVPSQLAVSSTVANPHDFPEHLIDGALETAWNGKTGDLVGGWIRFKVPTDSKVRYAELTVGYVRQLGDVDLFTANHRISKVTVLRDKVVLATHTLDPAVRTMQRIPIDATGGDFEIRIDETMPGTNPKWRELVVSEFRVVGDPGKERRATDDSVRVGVGKYGSYPPRLPPEDVGNPFGAEAFADLEALCSAWPAKAKKLQAAEPETYWGEKIKYGAPVCKEIANSLALAADATYLGVATVRLSDGYVSWSAPVVQTPRGFVLTGYEYDRRDPTDPGCPSIVRPETLDSVSVRSGHLVFITGNSQVAYREASSTDNDEGAYATLLQGAFWCRESAAGLACKRYHPHYQVPLASKDAPANDPWAKKGWAHIPWSSPSPYTISPNGELRISDKPTKP